MAKLAPGFGFTGSFGNLSAYKMRGHDQIILRGKGGPSKTKISTSPSFEITRYNNMEFAGRSMASRWIMRGMHPHKSLADYNIAGPLHSILKPIQVLDSKSQYGKRAVCLSKNPTLLEGFSLNRKTIFDSVIRSPLHAEVSKAALTAVVTLPALSPGINFFPSPHYPFFSVSFTLAVVPDFFYDTNGYRAAAAYKDFFSSNVTSEWFAVNRGCDQQRFDLKIDKAPPDDQFSLMLSVGLCYGELTTRASPQQAKYAGAAKILAMQ